MSSFINQDIKLSYINPFEKVVDLSDFQEELDDDTGEVDYYYVDIEHGLNIDYVPIVSIIDYNTNETYVCSIEKIDNNKIRLKTLDTAKIIIKII